MNKNSVSSLDTASHHQSHQLEADNGSHQAFSCGDQCDHCAYCHGAAMNLRIIASTMISPSPPSHFTPMISIDVEVDIKPPKPPAFLFSRVIFPVLHELLRRLYP